MAQFSSTVSRSNWNLEMFVFLEGGNPQYMVKSHRNKDENQQQTQPTYDVGSEILTWAALLGGECSHQCAIPQRAKKVLSNSPGLVNLLVRLVDSILRLPDGQVKFLGGI